MLKEVKGFFGDFRFLSNFHIANVEYEGIIYPTTEAAFQAAKTFDIDERRKIAAMSEPKLAKRAGKRLKLRPDWESVKYNVMAQVCWEKFSKHSDLKQALLDTDDAYLEETNTWGDKIWGVSDGIGTNWLGKILMNIRSRLKSN